MNVDVENWQSAILNRPINLHRIPREALIRELLKEREEFLKFEEEFGEDLKRRQVFLKGVLCEFKRVYPEEFRKFFGKKHIKKIIRML